MMSETQKPPPGVETYIPVPRALIMGQVLTLWPEGERARVTDVLNAMARLRQQESAGGLDRIMACYAPFNPDGEHAADAAPLADAVSLKATLVEEVEKLVGGANFRRFTEADLETILSGGSARSIVVDVDFGDYEIMQMYYRGDAVQPRGSRTWRRLWLAETLEEVEIFRRLLLIVKLKPRDVRIKELMLRDQIDAAKARRRLGRVRAALANSVAEDQIYFKLFRNIAKRELEMLFPNIRLKLSYRDKLRFGLTAGGSTIATLFGFFTNIVTAMASPITLMLAVGGVIGALFQQIMNFFNTRNAYMLTLAQNLYFHNMANNKSVLTLLMDEAEEEEIKGDMLLYAFVATAPGGVLDRAAARQGIEALLAERFAVEGFTFDAGSALERLREDELLAIRSDGRLEALSIEGARTGMLRRWRRHLMSDDEVEVVQAAPDIIAGLSEAGDVTPASRAAASVE